MEQEQFYAAVIVIGVIFSILTNVALYYYGEAKDLKRKVNQGDYLLEYRVIEPVRYNSSKGVAVSGVGI